MLKSIKTLIILVSFIIFNPVLALTKPTGSTVNTISEANIQIEPSIPIESWSNFQQGLNTFLQLDSAMTKQFFANPTHFNRMMMQENPKQYLISFDMPGIDPRKIKVSISQRVLFVQARNDATNKRNRDEQNHYDFSYHVALPDNANAKKVNAVLHRGILKVTIEKNNQLAAMIEIPVKEIA